MGFNSGFKGLMAYNTQTHAWKCFSLRLTDSEQQLIYKGKAIPLQTWTDPEGSRRMRLPDFKTIGTRRW